MMKHWLFVLLIGFAPLLWSESESKKDQTSYKVSRRLKVIDYYLPALDLKGKAYRGKETFRERCAFCHKATHRGHAFGPNISTLKEKGKVYIMTNMIDPNLLVLPGYEAHEIETTNELLRGIVTKRTAELLTLKLPLGQIQRIPPDEIIRIKALEKSMMPENLDSGLSHQDMADLLEYLMTQ